MSFPQGPGNGNNPNPNNNRNNGNPFTNPFNRGNNGNNGKGNNNENRPIWQSPWLWGAVLVVMVVLMSRCSPAVAPKPSTPKMVSR